MANNSAIFGAILVGAGLGAGAMGALGSPPTPQRVEAPAPVDTSPENGCTGIFKRFVGQPCDGNNDGARCGHLACPPAPTATPTATVRPVCVEDPTAVAYIEVCDGRDNDCDGRTDEDFKLRLPCSAPCPAPDGGVAPKAQGITACAADGTVRCAADCP